MPDNTVLKNMGENTGYQAKMFFKSHDLTQPIQFISLFLPICFGIISLSLQGIMILDICAVILSVFSLVYYNIYGKNQALFMERGEKYIVLYHSIENYYKQNETYDQVTIKQFESKQNELNLSKSKPNYHIFVKNRVEKTIDGEMIYRNEDKPRYA